MYSKAEWRAIQQHKKEKQEEILPATRVEGSEGSPSGERTLASIGLTRPAPFGAGASAGPKTANPRSLSVAGTLAFDHSRKTYWRQSAAPKAEGSAEAEESAPAAIPPLLSVESSRGSPSGERTLASIVLSRPTPFGARASVGPKTAKRRVLPATWLRASSLPQHRRDAEETEDDEESEESSPIATLFPPGVGWSTSSPEPYNPLFDVEEAKKSEEAAGPVIPEDYEDITAQPTRQRLTGFWRSPIAPSSEVLSGDKAYELFARAEASVTRKLERKPKDKAAIEALTQKINTAPTSAVDAPPLFSGYSFFHVAAASRKAQPKARHLRVYPGITTSTRLPRQPGDTPLPINPHALSVGPGLGDYPAIQKEVLGRTRKLPGDGDPAAKKAGLFAYLHEPLSAFAAEAPRKETDTTASATDLRRAIQADPELGAFKQLTFTVEPLRREGVHTAHRLGLALEREKPAEDQTLDFLTDDTTSILSPPFRQIGTITKRSMPHN